MDLARRSTAAERMDEAGLDPAVYARCLRDLTRVNLVTLTHRPTLRWLRRACRRVPAGQPVTILDVACGHGDLLRAIGRWALRAGVEVRLTGLDLNPASAAVARAATPAELAIEWQTGAVFAMAPSPAPDFIVSSQFAHHLGDREVEEFIRWLERHARRGWFIADLQRHVLAYWGFRLLAWVARWHPIVREDGSVSVARSFRLAEWRRLLAAAGVPTASVRWMVPFRICVARLK